MRDFVQDKGRLRRRHSQVWAFEQKKRMVRMARVVIIAAIMMRLDEEVGEGSGGAESGWEVVFGVKDVGARTS